MSADPAIFTYIRSRVTGSWAEFIAKHGAAVRAPEWTLAAAEKRALRDREQVSVIKPKKGKAA